MPRRPTCECGECGLCKQRVSKHAHYRQNSALVRARVAAYRERNIDQIRQYDRMRGFRVYGQGKAEARRQVRFAIARGDLTPQPCERCGFVGNQPDGRRAVHAHHDDYSKPLEVRWLCRSCHAAEHRTFA